MAVDQFQGKGVSVPVDLYSVIRGGIIQSGAARTWRGTGLVSPRMEWHNCASTDRDPAGPVRRANV